MKIDIKENENGDLVAEFTNKIYTQIIKDEDEMMKNAILKYAKENNLEIKLIDEETAKRIIDYGCQKYLKDYKSRYISKDKIKYIVDLYDNSHKELVELPNGEEMCCSDCAELIEYLREILKDK